MNKISKMVGGKSSYTQIWTHNCKGHVLNIQGTEYYLSPGTCTQKPALLTWEETKHVHSWSFTCLCWLLHSFSIIMKSSLTRGFSSNVESWNMISVCILHSILYLCSFLNVCIHLSSVKLQPWKWISKKLFSIYMP